MFEIILNNIGSFFSIAGTLCLAFAVGKVPEECNSTAMVDCKKELNRDYHYVCFIDPEGFWFGIALLIIGFAFQLNI